MLKLTIYALNLSDFFLPKLQGCNKKHKERIQPSTEISELKCLHYYGSVFRTEV